MKAALLREYHRPLELTELPVPEPLRPVDVLVRVGGAGVCATDLHACALLTPPGESGFDVAVGDGQPLGIPASFGGPHVGFMAVEQAQMRRIPGRLVGMTLDHEERRAYTLTL